MSSRRFRSTSLIEFNIVEYLNREFVNNSFYFNVASGFVATDGQRGDLLCRVNSNVYESFTDRWVLETDATGCPGFETIDPSGVVIDGVFHPKGAAPYIPAFDFANGRVIFEGSGVPASSVVGAEFSYKTIVLDLPDSNVVNVLFSAIRDNVDFTPHIFPSGNQRQLPLVVVDTQTNFNTPAELGGSKNKSQLVTFHILSTDRHQLNAITDFLQETQDRKVIKGVNFNVTPELKTANGDRASTYVNYSDLQASGAVAWNKIYIDQTRLVEKTQHFSIFRNRVDWTVSLRFLPPDGG
jgi:hypothetical protein